MRREFWPHCSDEEHALEIERIARGDCGVVFVAERESAGLCGFAELSIRHDHVEGASAAPVAYLEGWYVDADMRGREVGRQLLASAEQWAAERGFRELASDARLSNEQGIRAHRACGFAEASRLVHFIKPLRASAGLRNSVQPK